MIDSVLKSYLEHICGRGNVKTAIKMSEKTTFRIGGPAKFFVTAKTKGALVRAVSALKYIEYPFLIIGGGSNILFADAEFDGVVIKIAFREMHANGNFLYADAGAPIALVSRFAAAEGLGGLEFACGIPGTVGGAIYGNAGAHGSNIAAVVTMCDVLENGEIVSRAAAECGFGYRTSGFKTSKLPVANRPIILGAYFQLTPGQRDDIELKMAEYNSKRAASQPHGASAGCVFKNPTLAGQILPSAGAMIDRLGLKGARVGGAIVSGRHANFIINDGGATAADVLSLAQKIRAAVRAEYAIDLSLEFDIKP